MRIRQTAASFEMLLRRWLDTPEAQRAAVADEISKVFEEALAIFVLDMSGFSSSVARHGVVHFLAMIQRMRELVVPAVNRNGGELVKYIGDDVLAVFDDADEAYAAAREVGEIVALQNRDLAESLQIRVAIGIGYGPTLFVPGVDIWGDEATLAFKLGEDTAGPSEVLLTEAAYAKLSEPPTEFQRLDLDLASSSASALRRRWRVSRTVPDPAGCPSATGPRRTQVPPRSSLATARRSSSTRQNGPCFERLMRCADRVSAPGVSRAGSASIPAPGGPGRRQGSRRSLQRRRGADGWTRDRV